MFQNKILKVQKRDGTTVDFDQNRITDAIFKALTATGQGDGKRAKKLSDRVLQILNRRFKRDEILHVEQIQDIVEEVLILEGLVETAKAYILYREQRRRIREATAVVDESTEMVDRYLQELDWQVYENANMTYSLQGLNQYAISAIAKKYWLNKIYPKEIREAALNEDFHIHNLETIACYTFFGREVVITKFNNQIKLTSFKDLYEEISQSEILLNKKDDAWAKYPENLYVLDRNGWTKISRMVRKKREKEMRFIKSEQGRSIIVTDNHPFIVKKNREDNEQEIEAKDVQEKNDLIYSAYLPRLLSSENLFSKKCLYLAEELVNKNYQDFFLEGFEWRDFIENWGGSLKVPGTLSTSNNANSVNNQLELTEDLGYLVGLFISEGNYSSWRLTINISDEEVIKRIQRICANLGVRSYINKSEEKTETVSINSSTLKLVFEKIFQLKSLSQNKNLPSDILTYNSDFIRGVIAGIIDGDGSVDPDNKANSASQILIRVSSRTMLEQIAILLQFLGIIARDRVSVEDIGKKNIFKGREIIQNYPIYGISFSKNERVDFPSFKYRKARVAKKHWRAEEYDWNRVLNNKSTTISDDVIYDITTDSKTFLCNGLLVHNCMGWDLYDLLLRGFGGVLSKIESRPPKHFRTALGQLVNFLFTLQGESAGANAVSNFDTLLAPFIRYDNLNYLQVKQAMQEFLYNCMVPTRVGFQTPFINVSLDIKVPEFYKNQPVIIGGKAQKETYGDFQEEMNVFIRAFYEGLMEGDAKGRPMTFPIPTVSITKDFDWDDPNLNPMWEATAKYGINYFSNFIHGDLKPEDFRSMCVTPDTQIIYQNTLGNIGKMPIRRIVEDFIKMENFGKVLMNGEFVEIKNVLRLINKAGYVLKITLENGESFRVTPDHPSMFIKGNRLVKVQSEKLKVGDEIPIAKNPYKGKLGDFDLGRFVGLYIAEGYLAHNEATTALSFSSQEKSYSDFVTQFAQERFGAMTTVKIEEKHQSLVAVINDRTVGALVKNYVRGDNSLNKRLSSKLFGMSFEFREGVLIGILEGDGHISKIDTTRNIQINSSNSGLIDDIGLLCRSLGVNYTKQTNFNNSHFGVKFTSYKLLLTNDFPEWLGRYFNKKSGESKIYKDYKNFYGIKIKSIGKIPYTDQVYDFETKNNKHLFQLANGIITHNCCRLRLSNKELYKRGGGGLFGSAPLTGSCGVVTINMPRIGYLSKTKKEFFERLGYLMDLTKESLEIKRKALENFMEKGLYPYSKYYLASVKKLRDSYFGNHFSTIGLMGMNEALLNFIGENIASKRGRRFALEVLDFMRERLVKYQKETGNLYNLEATPGEGTSYRQAKIDKERYPDIITAGTKEVPYYTNSTLLPVNHTDDIFEALRFQDEIQCKYTGGVVLHLFLGERVSDSQMAKFLIKKIFENFRLPYITLTPTFSICPNHAYLAGEHFECPKCTIKQPCEVYSRIVGYLRPVQQWNLGKKEEFKWRREYRIYRNEKIISLPKEKIPSKIKI